MLRVRILISVIGGGSGGGCGCAPAPDFGVGGGVWFLGLAIVALSIFSVTGEFCVCVCWARGILGVASVAGLPV